MPLKFILITGLFLSAPTRAYAESECKNGAPVEQKTVIIKPYTITIFKDVHLNQNKSNRNFSLYVEGGKKGNCMLFSKEAILPAGEYNSENAYGIYTSCTDKTNPAEGKLAYAFTKFDSLTGKDVLRIQCFKARTSQETEQEETNRYAPQANDTKFVLENKTSKIRAKINRYPVPFL